MSWMQKLFETYEACSQNPAFVDPPQAENGGKEAPALMPVSHTSQQAHIHGSQSGVLVATQLRFRAVFIRKSA